MIFGKCISSASGHKYDSFKKALSSNIWYSQIPYNINHEQKYTTI